MSQASQVRTYDPSASVVFLKTKEAFGGLSNMAGGYPLRVNGVRILTSEALYQACRFPHMPDVQRKIIEEHSPMTAKMRSKPFRDHSRPDWDAVRVKIMKWCLRVKLAHHWSTFGELLLGTGDRPIVEQSRKDDFWGTKVSNDDKLVGFNVLGRLLMELREEIKSGMRERSTVVLPLELPDFLLFGQSIEPVWFGSKLVAAGTQKEVPKPDFHQMPTPIETAQRSLFEPVDKTVDARASENQIALQSQPPASQPVTIDGLRPYVERKPSGLPWLGDVPAHWDVRRNGRLFGARRETGFPALPVLEVSIRSGVRIRDFDNGGRKQEMADRSKYQRAVRGDIAYNMMRMWQGAIGVAPADGLVSPAYVVARPFPEADAAYYAYLFRTVAYMREIDVFSRGIVPDRNRLYWESFKQMPSVYPPLDEQRLIVRFLDWHGAQTAKLVRAKKKIIALLNEQKQAIIHRAVTRGLDPNATLKPSGIPWLGDVPEGWSMLPSKRVLKPRSSGGAPIKNTAALTQFPGYVPAFSASGQDIFLPEAKFSGPGIVLSAVGARCGKTFKADGEWAVAANTHVLLVPEVHSRDFWWYVTNLPDWWDRAGAAQPFVQVSKTLSKLWSFPDKSEQECIVEYIETVLIDLNAVTEMGGREIALIQEFRTRLIADVVTGKLDVRAAAASLPEIAEMEPTDDLTERDDLDEAIDDTANEEVAA